MSRCLPWLVLAACGTAPGASTVTAGEPEVPPASRAPIEVPAIAAPAPAQPPEPMITASPDGATTIAAPADGSYVVTADSSGGVRLWPALDGTREPVVVRALAAKQIATARDGDAIAIAVVDALGQLELARVTTEGRALDRISIETPRPVVQLVATSRGFVVLRDDQKLAVFDPRGGLRGELEPAPGERIVRLLASHDHVLAVMAARGVKRTARWIDDVAWGAATPRFTCDDEGLFLSPDGRELLGTAAGRTDVVLIDLVRGSESAVEHVVGGDPRFTTALGYRDAHTVRYMREGTVVESTDGHVHEVAGMFGLTWLATDHGAIGGGASYLMIETQGAPKYLGYRADQLADLIPAKAGGWMATDGASLVHLDATLRADRTFTTPFEEPDSWGQPITLIDERHVVIEQAQKRFLYELGKEYGDLMDSTGYGLVFERSTNLALIGGTQQALRWNPSKRAFDPEPIALSDEPYGAIRLYDPRAHDGMIAAQINEATDASSQVTDKEPIVRREISAIGPHEHHRDVRVLVPIDQLFSGRSGPNLETQLPEAVRWTESADGTLIAELAHGRITLHDRAGNVRWVRTADGARGLAWNAADELVAFGPGAAVVDLETGAFLVRQCGWRFGLWDKPPSVNGAAQICVAHE